MAIIFVISLKNDNLGLKMKISKFLVIQPSFGISTPIYTCLIVRKQNSAIWFWEMLVFGET